MDTEILKNLIQTRRALELGLNIYYEERMKGLDCFPVMFIGEPPVAPEEKTQEQPNL